MARRHADPRRASREPGADRRRASRRPTPSGSGARARRPSVTEVRASCTASRARSSRPSTWCAGSACWPAGRGSTSPAPPGYLDTDYAAKGRYAIDGPGRPRHRLRPRRGPRRGQPRGPRRRQGRGHRADRPRHRRPPSSRPSESYDQWRILISPDHSTLLRTRAHDRAPVAWTMAGTGLPASGLTYDEIAAREGGGPFLEQGYRLMERFLDLNWKG